MANVRKSRADIILEEIEKIESCCNNQPSQHEAISGSDLRGRYSRLPDGLKKPVELAHLIAILGALVDQMAQTPGDFLKGKEMHS